MKVQSTLFVVLFFLVLISIPAFSATINVPADSTTIQAGLNGASDGDTVLVQPGIYYENIHWPAVNGITLLSAGDTTDTFIDGSNTDRVFRFNSSVLDTTTVLSGFTIQNGRNGEGAGIICINGATPLLTNLHITNNSAYVDFNVDNDGGGIHIQTGNHYIRNVIFSNNHGGFRGGAIYATSSNIYLFNVKFINNQVREWGGGIYNESARTFAENVTFISNSADSKGGAIFGLGLRSTYDNVLAVDNSSPEGSFIYQHLQNATITNATIAYNNATDDGAIYVYDAILNLNNCNIFEPNGYAIRTDIDDEVVNAENNWWGDQTGPYNPTTNPRGLGATISANVDFEPYLDSPDVYLPLAPVKNITVDYSYDLVATISWDENPIPDLSHYILYYDNDESGEPFANSIDVGQETTFDLTEITPESDYYVAVSAVDYYGNESMIIDEATFYSRHFGIENLTLDNVEDFNRVTTQNPIISYDYFDDQGDDQQQYRLQVSTDSTFSTVDRWNSGWTISTSTNIPYGGSSLEEGEILYLRIRVEASDGNRTKWYYLQFTMNGAPAAINQMFPSEMEIINEEAELIVNESFDVNGDTLRYSFNVYEDEGLTQPVAQVSDILENTWIVDPPLPDDQWYWWTCEVTDGDLITTTDSATTFRMNVYDDPPENFSLAGPQDGSICVTGDTLLTWSESSDVDYEDVITYIVYISNTIDFTSEVDSFFTPGTSLEVHNLPQNQIYWWKIKAQDTNTNGTWSTETWSFSVALPDAPEPFTLISPHDNAIIGSNSVEFKWSSSSDPDPGDEISYEVQWSIDSDFSNYESATTSDTIYSVIDLNDDETLFWRVKAIDNTGLYIWSIQGEEGWSFEVDIQQPPEAFSLIAPSDAVELDTLASTFRWNRTYDPDPDEEVNYFLSLSLDENFEDTLTVLYQANADTCFPVPYMQDDTDYWWKVLAFDDMGNTTPSTETWNFHTAWPEPPHPFELDGGSIEMNTTGDSIVVSLTWQRTWDPDPESHEYYKVLLDTTQDMVDPIVLVDSLIVTGPDSMVTFSKTYVPEDLPMLGDGFWTIYAYDNNTDGTWAGNVMSLYFTGVDDIKVPVPGEFAITSLYPNPFNPTLTAVISLPLASHLEVTVFNVMGQKVASLANGEFTQGHHSLVFDGTGMASGVYFIHVSVPGKMNQVQKIILMK